MSFYPANLGPWSGRISRGPYFVLGVILFLAKFGLEWLVARFVFGRDWNFYNYLVLPGEAIRLLELPEGERVFFTTLLVLALPFIGAGVFLTVQRLRAAELPIALAVFFFIPVVNLFFFVALSIVPDRSDEPQGVAVDPELRQVMGPERFDRFRAACRRITRGNPTPSAAVALAVSVPLALGFVLLSVSVLHNYGWGLFVGLPFCLGLGSVLLFGAAEPQRFGKCIGVAMLAATLVGACMLLLAMEGAICLIMAAPIGYLLVFLGAVVGYAIQSRPWSNQESPYLLLALTLSLPALMGAEAAIGLEPPVLQVCTTIDINASPEQVWKHVVSFPPLPEPEEWLFRAGVAYPTKAEIRGRGPGAVRCCVFSTGTFVEPIEVWDEPRLLRFTVTDQPPPMVEWSPYEIHPPHLDHYLVSRRGQFRLVPLPHGRTRLEGTTWYVNHMWPAAYWQLWSDHIIHAIHGRVLRHIKERAESAHTAK